MDLSHFLEVLLHQPLGFKERPTLVLVFANRKKWKEDFCFHKAVTTLLMQVLHQSEVA